MFLPVVVTIWGIHSDVDAFLRVYLDHSHALDSDASVQFIQQPVRVCRDKVQQRLDLLHALCRRVLLLRKGDLAWARRRRREAEIFQRARE